MRLDFLAVIATMNASCSGSDRCDGATMDLSKANLPSKAILAVERSRFSFIIFTLVCTILVFIGAVIVQVQSGSRIAREALTRELLNSAHHIRATLKSELASAERAINFVADTFFIDTYRYPGTFVLPKEDGIVGVDIIVLNDDRASSVNTMLPKYNSPHRGNIISFFSVPENVDSVYLSPSYRRHDDPILVMDFARAVVSNNGTIEAYVSTQVSIEKIIDDVRRIDLGNENAYAIICGDSKIRLRYLKREVSYGAQINENNLAILRRVDDGQPVEHQSSVDAVHRYGVALRLAEYPLFIVVSRAANSLDRIVYEELRFWGIVFFLGFALMFVFVVELFSRSQELQSQVRNRDIETVLEATSSFPDIHIVIEERYGLRLVGRGESSSDLPAMLRSAVKRLSSETLEATGVSRVCLFEDGDRAEFLGLCLDLPFLPSRKRAYILIDTLAHREHEEAAYRMNRLASLGLLSVGIGHEISSPTAKIQMLADLMRSQIQIGHVDKGELLDAFESIHRLAKRLGQIVNNMRAFVNNNRDTRHVCSSTLIETALSFVHSELASHDIDLDIHLEGKGKIEAAGSADLDQVVLNLVSNARNAIVERMRSEKDIKRGLIRVTTLRETGENGRAYLNLCVSDNGGGVPAVAMPRLFEPFYSTRLKFGGTGIGLSICAAFARSVKGEISVQNVGDGASFCLKIPIIEE